MSVDTGRSDSPRVKRLIVNADDFGFTRGVNEGILSGFKNGILTSTTIMANGDAFEDAVITALANPALGVGVHLAIIGGRPVAPVSQVQSLVDADGRLPRTLSELVFRVAKRSIDPAEIEVEFSAQIERVMKAGIAPTHVDTHKHSQIVGAVAGAVTRVANRFGITKLRYPFEAARNFSLAGRAARVNRMAYIKQCLQAVTASSRARSFKRLADEAGLRTPDRFFGMALTGLLDSAAILNVVRMLDHGTSELMCHPGVYDDSLERAPTRLKSQRQRELDALTDPEVLASIRERGVELISFRELD